MQGLNIMQFCKEYNAATQDKVGTVIPVEITCFEVRLQSRRLRYVTCMAARILAVEQRFIHLAGSPCGDCLCRTAASPSF